MEITDEMRRLAYSAFGTWEKNHHGLDAAIAAVAPLIAARVYEDCMAVARDFPIPDDASSSEMHGRLMAGLGIAAAIRARGMP